MAKTYTAPEAQREYGKAYYHGPVDRIRLDDEGLSKPLRVNWSGYGIPPSGATTVAQVEGYYLRGEAIVYEDGSTAGAPDPADAERLAEIGEPISGDEIARFRAWQALGQGWPSFEAIKDSLMIERDEYGTGTLF